MTRENTLDEGDAGDGDIPTVRTIDDVRVENGDTESNFGRLNLEDETTLRHLNEIHKELLELEKQVLKDPVFNKGWKHLKPSARLIILSSRIETVREELELPPSWRPNNRMPRGFE